MKAFKAFLTVVICLLSSFVIFNSYADSHDKTIPPLDKQQIKKFFLLINLPRNHDKKITVGGSKKISDFKFSSGNDFNIQGEYLLKKNSIDDPHALNSAIKYQLYRLEIGNSNRIFYVVTEKDIGGTYGPTTDILAIYLKKPDDTVVDYSNKGQYAALIGIIGVHPGTYYNQFDGFSHCGHSICSEVSIEVPADWNAVPKWCAIPTVEVYDWIKWPSNTLRIYSREIHRIVCIDGNKKASTIQFIKQIKEQVKNRGIQLSWLKLEEDPQKLIEALQHIDKPLSLQTVSITDIPLGATGLKVLSQWLSSVKDLKELNLSYDEISSLGGKNIAKLINNNPSLVSLNLSGDTFNAKQALFLAKAIQHAKKLKTLKLSYSLYSTKAMSRIATATNENPAIKIVDLSYVGLLNKNSMDALIEILNNKHVDSLDLSNDANIVDKLIQEKRFSKLILNNKSLLKLTLGSDFLNYGSTIRILRKLVKKRGAIQGHFLKLHLK